MVWRLQAWWRYRRALAAEIREAEGWGYRLSPEALALMRARARRR